jgi:formylglycine-generating enzyme required for sulfatase activity
MRRPCRSSGAALGLLLGAAVAADGNDSNPLVRVEGSAHFQSALQSGKADGTAVRSFMLQRHPVTNAEFLAFVNAHPEWRRDAVPALFADGGYLSHWRSAAEPGPEAPALQPVTRVSWFAAEAYCEAQGARLPAWSEWELAAAADAQTRDARADPAWRQSILDWYARPAVQPLAAVEQSPANVYGLHDLHGLVWEWVLDANSLMSREEAQKFCGSGALSLQQKENYAVLMRVAMLSSLRPADTGRALGFRCAADLR